MFRMDGRACIVTGASSGLGARFAEVLHAAGAIVVLAARRRERLDDLASRLDRAVAVECDVASEADRARLVATAERECGRVDVLVNNAGVSQMVRMERESLEQWEETFAVNVTAVHRLALLAGAGMLERGSGVVVNVASMYGFVARWDIPGAASYAATKAAVVNLTRELGAQWARRGVRVNGLAPGYFPSEMTGDGLDDSRFRDRLDRRCPAGRPGRPHELDGALLFLASDASSYMVGQTIVVDGGWTAV
ncbi:MAG: SDR family oxidoreductase [Acidimicrobiia bacterium]|nr:SDR family oxidoreductase [Acidimicrobiia bacterium]